MTTEQREAIELAKGFTKMDFSNPIGWTGYYDTELKELSQAIDTALSLIKQLESEKEIHVGLEHQYKKEYLDMLDLTKKYKRQIDLMAEQLAGLTTWDIEKDEPLILGDKEEVINYFENKVNSKIQ